MTRTASLVISISTVLALVVATLLVLRSSGDSVRRAARSLLHLVRGEEPHPLFEYLAQ